MGKLKVIDIADKRFGNIVVTSRAVNNDLGTATWNYLCDCGNNGIDTGANIRNFRKTCGMQCPLHLARIRKGYAKGQAGLVQAWNMYRRRAMRRRAGGLEFSISRETAFRIFKSNCYYCGTGPANIAKSCSAYGGCLYTGIDRVDPAIGYTESNVRPCCWNCNRMKGTLTEQEFFALLKLILKVQRGRQH